MASSLVNVEKNSTLISKSEHNESVAFLRWLLGENFTFLGYCDYDFVENTTTKTATKEKLKSKEYTFEPKSDSALGLFKKFDYRNVCHYADLPPSAQEFYFSKKLLMLGKLNTVSTVHRPAYIDFIAIKKFDTKFITIKFK